MRAVWRIRRRASRGLADERREARPGLQPRPAQPSHRVERFASGALQLEQFDRAAAARHQQPRIGLQDPAGCGRRGAFTRAARSQDRDRLAVRRIRVCAQGRARRGPRVHRAHEARDLGRGTCPIDVSGVLAELAVNIVEEIANLLIGANHNVLNFLAEGSKVVAGKVEPRFIEQVSELPSAILSAGR